MTYLPVAFMNVDVLASSFKAIQDSTRMTASQRLELLSCVWENKKGSDFPDLKLLLCQDGTQLKDIL